MALKWTDDEQVMKQRILLCGRAKTGKTFLSATWPKPLFLNSDKGTATLRDKRVPFWDIDRPTEGNNVKPYKMMRKMLLNLRNQEGEYWEELKEADYTPETIVLDSLTALSDIFEAEITMYPPDGKDRGEALQIQDYNIIQRRLFALLDIGRELPYHFIVTAGVDLDKDELGKMIENPAATGNKLGARVPHFFDEVYLLEKEGGDEKNPDAHWLLTPAQTKRFFHSGSRWGLPIQYYKNPTYEKLSKYYVQKKGK